MVSFILDIGDPMHAHLEHIKKSGLKITSQRKAVLGLFLKKNSRKTPCEVHDQVKKRLPQLGLPTVYRILEELKEIGLIVRIFSEDRQLYYSLCHLPDRKHHHHFFCLRCQRVEEVDFCNFKNIPQWIENELNAKVASHQLQIEGFCSKCK